MGGGRFWWWALTLAFCIPGGSNGAAAGAFGTREQNARSQGAAFAGAAAGSGGLGSIFWNPASIALFPGLQSESDLSLSGAQARLSPDPYTLSSMDALGGSPWSSGDMGVWRYTAASYASYQLNSSWWIGAALNSPYGFISKPRQDWAGQTYARSSHLMSVAVTPTVGYRVNDWLTIGGGVTAQYLDLTFKQATFAAPGASSAILQGDDLGLGFSLGATMQPRPGTMVGIGYRSPIHHEVSGQWAATPGIPMPMKTGLTLPEMVSVGVSQQLNPRWTILATGEWTNWSRLDRSAVFNRATGLPVSSLSFGYRDGTFLSLGAEYQWQQGVAMRAGVGFETSPVTNEARNPRLIDSDKVWASIGASYQATDRLGLDIGYSRQFMRQAPVRITGAHPDFNGSTFIADGKASADIISFAWRYRWDAPPRPTFVDRYAPATY
ncbi:MULTISPECIES: outer membrane protein transport protein [unclassified Chelatococcus]|uniref:OmpP1/FadL family transporter n=1 Tax=unclassified Chelatococcus TaxID=2638111 RepID=UPI001BCD03CB|nr:MULTISPECIES: outer membrane protein transport protein [unclassified Chelatococcus]CAH1671941.1 Long-chain fatty acid transport protein [Hyphomicrobiales bacterium]MBS7739016.1 outer membrane protein transport protein [Chelatococcus sp. HY11]MBX3543451.1 outer membrane protein transport protein [Chelatococcus sp.]MCO5076454.1 outer membrane protein transport protein [Chelatococcus sp.]CAH1675846.1 Long-chain fatty acid transport protein [Hyphomicrobiales bacterium]